MNLDCRYLFQGTGHPHGWRVNTRDRGEFHQKVESLTMFIYFHGSTL